MFQSSSSPQAGCKVQGQVVTVPTGVVSILIQPEDRMQVTPAESRRIMQGIARAHGKAQRQAKPLTAEALAAVKATAKSRHPLEDGKRQESAERASWRGRVDVA